ncbi:Epidermal patterning factor-like protein [Melia azedarach]|uniref:Epidermal patterning factor-like protein n=1 Tax=Melia azedarach TaxID=155640 RepID=A0ACC1Y2G5_MELAZ|nr:Epidermal patterning factor-like protein [Melia azedarach]
MERKLWCFLFLAIQILSCVSATSRTFAPTHDLAVHQPVPTQSPQPAPAITTDTNLSPKKGLNVNSKIGSTPPSCEHKCYGCIPCEAIQVPTTSSHLGIQYANYEPEGWKCKCGPSLYTP